MDKIYKKVEEYLRKQFPKKKLIRYAKITDKNAELYGTMSLPIKIVEKNNEVFYQVMFNSKLKK
jgi:hypothetical protein